MKKRQSVFVWGFISIGLLLLAIIMFLVGQFTTKPNFGALMANAFRFFGTFNSSSIMNTIFSYLMLIFALLLGVGFILLYRSRKRYTSIIFCVIAIVYAFFGLIFDVSLLGDITRMITGAQPMLAIYVIGFFAFNIGITAYVVLFVIDIVSGNKANMENYYCVSNDELAKQKVDLRDDPIEKPLFTSATNNNVELNVNDEIKEEPKETIIETEGRKRIIIHKTNKIKSSSNAKRNENKVETKTQTTKVIAKEKQHDNVNVKHEKLKKETVKKTTIKTSKKKSSEKGKEYAYYSKILDKPFDSLTSLNKAEKEYKQNLKVNKSKKKTAN